MRCLHQQDECHLCQLHCEREAKRQEERPVRSNFHFLGITTFQRDYEFTKLERAKSETEENKELFRWDDT